MSRARRGGAAAIPVPTERQVQRAILKMCGLCFRDVLIHHSPNGSHLAGSARDRRVQGGILVGDGVKKGFPDLLVLWSPGRGALIEVKRPKQGRVTPEQAELHERLRELDWPVAVVATVDEAYAFLAGCGAPRSAELIGAAA